MSPQKHSHYQEQTYLAGKRQAQSCRRGVLATRGQGYARARKADRGDRNLGRFFVEVCLKPQHAQFKRRLPSGTQENWLCKSAPDSVS